MTHSWRIGAASGALLAVALAAAAQTPAFVTVSAGGAVNGRLTEASPRGADGSRHACYAVNTRAGETVTVTLRSAAFAPRISVGRGAACASARYQYLGSGAAGGKDAHVSFKAGGGRYLIMAQGVGAGLGAYQLEIGGSAGGEAAPQQVASLDRREVMNLQVERRRAEVAAEEARQRALAAERARQAAERARQAELARLEEEAWLAEQEAAAAEEEVWDDPPPAQPNVALAFTNAFADATQKHAMEREQQQQRLDQINANARAIAEARERAERARLAQQESAARLSQQQQTAARLAQQEREAAERQRRVAEEQRLAEQRRLAQQQAAERARLAAASSSSSSSSSFSGSSAQKSCSSRIVSGEARSNRLSSRAAAESFVRNQPNFCPDGTRAPLGPMQCSSMEESVPDKSCLTSVKVCPRRTVWTCSAKYTCAAPLVSCVGGGGSRQ